jgi:hypothetical protein
VRPFEFFSAHYFVRPDIAHHPDKRAGLGIVPVARRMFFLPELASGIEPLTSSLPRMCSTN